MTDTKTKKKYSAEFRKEVKANGVPILATNAVLFRLEGHSWHHWEVSLSYDFLNEKFDYPNH